MIKNRKDLKIYFAGSIFGGRENVSIYKKIIDLLKKYGEVLTEHVGDEKYISVSEEKEIPADLYIYTRDVKWIKDSDVFIADVTVPSIGVGYEIGYAESLGKRILCIYNSNGEKRLSFMISGNKNLNVKIYKDIDEVKKILDEFFK